jgi:hypothetical protein
MHLPKNIADAGAISVDMDNISAIFKDTIYLKHGAVIMVGADEAERIRAVWLRTNKTVTADPIECVGCSHYRISREDIAETCKEGANIPFAVPVIVARCMLQGGREIQQGQKRDKHCPIGRMYR